MKALIQVSTCPPDDTAVDVYTEAGALDATTGVVTFVRNDQTTYEVDISAFKANAADIKVPEAVTQYVINNLLNLKYIINTQAADYTLTQDDFNGYTIVNAVGPGDQTITITKPASEDQIGRAVVIHKGAGAAGTFLHLATAAGVELTARDITPLRRIGNAVSLIYAGAGKFITLGELP